MPRADEPELLTARETCSRMNMDELRSLLTLVGGPVQGRKAELVDQAAGILESPKEVRVYYDSLDDLAQKAVQEAAHDPQGVWRRSRFAAKYGRLPGEEKEGRNQYQSDPAGLRLFFPRGYVLPTDLRTTLLQFVPEPPPVSVAAGDDLPGMVRRPHVNRGSTYYKPDEEEVELRVRETARAALLDVKAVLRLVDAGEVKVGEKTRRPSQVGVKAVAGVLSEGDFYEDADRGE